MNSPPDPRTLQYFDLPQPSVSGSSGSLQSQGVQYPIDTNSLSRPSSQGALPSSMAWSTPYVYSTESYDRLATTNARGNDHHWLDVDQDDFPRSTLRPIAISAEDVTWSAPPLSSAAWPSHGISERVPGIPISTRMPCESPCGTRSYSPMPAVTQVSVLAPEVAWPRKAKVATQRVMEAARKRRRNVGKFVCPVQECSQTFTARHNLNYHTNSHFDIKPYNCSHCDKTFVTPTDCKRHKRSCSLRPN